MSKRIHIVCRMTMPSGHSWVVPTTEGRHFARNPAHARWRIWRLNQRQTNRSLRFEIDTRRKRRR